MKKFLKKKLYVFICQQPFSKVFSPSSINDSSKTFIATIFVTFKSLYPFKVNNMYISNLNNYLLCKNKSNKSFIFIIFIYSASASFFLSSLWNSNCVRETFLCLQYSNDRQFIPSSFDEIDVLICTKNDKNDERKVLYTTVFHFMNGYDNHKYYLLKKSYITSRTFYSRIRNINMKKETVQMWSILHINIV